MSVRICRFCWLGRVDYGSAWRLQKILAEDRAAERIEDTLLMLEHPPTYTLGRRGSEAHLLVDGEVLARQGVEVHRVDRGGDITFHGPGQLVGYPVVSLEGRQGGASRYLRDLEEVLILGLESLGVSAGRQQGLTGVWVGGEKIAAIGVKINARRVTGHGFALNVTTDLGYFRQIVPCGIRGKGVTSLARVLGHPPDMARVQGAVVDAFGQVFGMEMVPVSPESIAKLMEECHGQGSSGEERGLRRCVGTEAAGQAS